MKAHDSQLDTEDSSAVREYYERAPEESRLDLAAPFRLEEYRSRELILRHMPAPPGVVLDIGGAAGAYAFWLRESGYDVRLYDTSRRLVEIARRRNETLSQGLTSCDVADARSIPEPAGAADVVLLLGPLYHLVNAADRQAALLEVHRVLKPGGLVLAAGISRWASILDGLSREILRDAAFARIVERDLLDGRHENPTDRVDYFTTAYFHRPEDLRREVSDAGFDVEALYGIEGPAWILSDLADRWAHPDRRTVVLQAARALESEPATCGWSAHLMVVGRLRSAARVPSRSSTRRE